MLSRTRIGRSFTATTIPLVMVMAMAVAVGGAACRSGRAGANPGAPVDATVPTVILHAGNPAREVPVRVELARTDAERTRGLMFRNHLEPQDGMLFLFPESSSRAFWMKNTLIPLDMIFIGHDHRIVGIVENAAPETENPRRVNGDSQYVLEIGGGLSSHWGITAGSAVEFRGLPADAATN